jgi:site-specific DNA recombinase
VSRSTNAGKSDLQKREALSYVRVSSKDQEKEGFSIPAQLKLLRGYAAERGLAVLREFDDVETAKRAGRTGFLEMIQFFRKRPACRLLLVEKTDRLYRNLKDWVTLDELKLEIHFVKENVILSPDSRSAEKLIHGIKVLMAKNYIDNLSEETRKGMLEKAEQGIWPSFAPLGYLNAKGLNGKRAIEPDPVVGPLITLMYGWCATGDHSLRQITEMARSHGLVFRKSKKPVRARRFTRFFGIAYTLAISTSTEKHIMAYTLPSSRGTCGITCRKC